MTFQEKSAIVTAGSLALVYGFYFAIVGRWMTVSPVGEIVYQPLLIAAIVPLTILAIVSHILLALLNPKAANANDERDRLITLRSERAGGFVLAVSVFQALVLAMLEVPHFYIAQSLLLGWVLAELIEAAIKVVLYRRGA